MFPILFPANKYFSSSSIAKAKIGSPELKGIIFLKVLLVSFNIVILPS